MEAEKAFHACREEGGAEDECKTTALQAFETCIATHCPSEPGDCPARCEEMASHVQQECLEHCAEGEACSAICQQAYDVALERCTIELCGGAGCEDDAHACCLTRCEEVAHGVLAECIAVHGAEAEAVCAEQAKAAFAACADDQCGEEPEVPCAERCAERAAEAVRHCLEEGKPAEVCEALGEELQEHCLAEHCAEPGPTCEEQCQKSAEGAFVDCVVAGGSEADCETQAEAVRAACVAARCGTLDPSCPDRCEEAVEPIVAACLEAGFSEAFCRAQAEEAVRHCIDEHCDDEEAPDPSCEERCGDHARHALRRCLAEGGMEIDCKEAARAGFETCVQLHCNPAEGCVERCERKARRVNRRCLRSGGSEEECAATAAAAHRACVAARCAPEPPETCDSECEARAKAVEESCLAAGNPEGDCEAAEQGVMDQCVGECGAAPDPTCTETCEELAQTRFTGALAATGDSTQAGKRGRRTFRRCALTCE
jgi:hypothetical protein